MMYEKSDFGMGLSPRAQKVIQSLRMATDELDLALTQPRNDLPGDRSDNEAYLLTETGQKYAIYFPAGGSVSLDLGTGNWHYRRVNFDEATWRDAGDLQTGGEAILTVTVFEDILVNRLGIVVKITDQRLARVVSVRPCQSISITKK